MKSAWLSSNADEHSVPVEMRFIDMFMTALGSLIFIALLLVFLLPKSAVQSAATPVPDNTVSKEVFDNVIAKNKALEQRIANLNSDLQALLDSKSGKSLTANEGLYDKEVVKRSLAVLIVTKGCESREPELYVRWEGPLINFETRKPIETRSLTFDVVNPFAKTILVGQRYLEIGYGVDELISALRVLPVAATSLDAFSHNRLQLKYFEAVSNSIGPYSVYAALTDAERHKTVACSIYPIYVTSHGLYRDVQFNLTQNRPYAWLRRFTIAKDGALTFDTGGQFEAELADFSKTQSTKLCQEKKLCDTVDAHYWKLKEIPGSSKVKMKEFEVPSAPPAPSKVKISKVKIKEPEVPSPPPAQPDAPSLWDFRSSILRLVADGKHRTMYYETLDDAQRQQGVTKGAIFFDGEKRGTHYVGTSYAYVQGCPPKRFDVLGDISTDEKHVTLRGEAPLLNKGCGVYGHYSEVLNIDFRQP